MDLVRHARRRHVDGSIERSQRERRRGCGCVWSERERFVRERESEESRRTPEEDHGLTGCDGNVRLRSLGRSRCSTSRDRLRSIEIESFVWWLALRWSVARRSVLCSWLCGGRDREAVECVRESVQHGGYEEDQPTNLLRYHDLWQARCVVVVGYCSRSRSRRATKLMKPMRHHHQWVVSSSSSLLMWCLGRPRTFELSARASAARARSLDCRCTTKALRFIASSRSTRRTDSRTSHIASAVAMLIVMVVVASGSWCKAETLPRRTAPAVSRSMAASSLVRRRRPDGSLSVLHIDPFVRAHVRGR